MYDIVGVAPACLECVNTRVHWAARAMTALHDRAGRQGRGRMYDNKRFLAPIVGRRKCTVSGLSPRLSVNRRRTGPCPPTDRALPGESVRRDWFDRI